MKDSLGEFPSLGLGEGRKSRNEWWEIGNKGISQVQCQKKKGGVCVHCLNVLKSQP